MESVYTHSHREKSSWVIPPRLESGSQVGLILSYTLLYFQIVYNDHCYFDNQGKKHHLYQKLYVTINGSRKLGLLEAQRWTSCEAGREGTELASHGLAAS